MTSDEERTLTELLAKKKAEEQRMAPVLQLISGGGEKNVWADALAEAAAMARKDELLDYALVYIKKEKPDQLLIRHGIAVPSLQILAGANTLNAVLLSRLMNTTK